MPLRKPSFLPKRPPMPPAPGALKPAAPAAVPSLSRESALSPLRAIDVTTLQVDAGDIEKIGIRKLRVLDESRFAALIEQMVESRMRGVAGASSPPVAEREQDDVLRREYQSRWVAFKTQWEERLRSIEERLESALRKNGSPPPRG